MLDFFPPKDQINITAKGRKTIKENQELYKLVKWTLERYILSLFFKDYEYKPLKVLRNLMVSPCTLCLLTTQATFFYLQVFAAAAIDSGSNKNILVVHCFLYPLATHLPAEISPGSIRLSKMKEGTQANVYAALL